MTFAVILLSIVVCMAYLCRLDGLRVFEHKASFIALHVALAGCSAAAGVHAWQGTLDVQDITGLFSAALWIVVSYHTWKSGPPEHTKTKPEALDPLLFHKVFGGRKE